ncbi:MAG TPA: enoyl-CoA hydratase-related protein, partial [Planctomycetaceae bacterium]|nr:enoyl-CoA hydratase-related protein [Planctomycetaceae bacterium]
STRIELISGEPVARVRFTSDRGVQLFSAAVRHRLGEVLDELEGLPRCRVVVFEASGRTFIAGADIHELRTLNVTTARELAAAGQALMNRIAALPAVTIAAVHAACAGGGCELALACDLRMAARAARIGLPEVSLGVIPGWGGTVRAVRLFGGAAARRLILTGELLPAEEALRLGIVDSLAADDAFRERVEERVQLLLSRGPAACRHSKRLIAAFEGGAAGGPPAAVGPKTATGRPPLATDFESEAVAFGECFASGEAAEGLAAFLEKRPAVWT